MPTKIEWTHRLGTTGESWNPIQDTRKGKSGRGYHCTKCSSGCDRCWAEDMNNRFGNRQPFDDAPVEFEIVEKQLERPLHWRKARTVSVQLMGDLFHERIAFGLVERVLSIIDATDQHTYLLLTKRPARMHAALTAYIQAHNQGDPLPNLWAGVSICTGEEMHKMNILQGIPAVVRFISFEPLLSDIQLPNRPQFSWFVDRSIHWAIVGAESDSGARLMDLDWARSIRDRCVSSGTPFFFKRASDGCETLDGKIWHQFPEVRNAE